MRRLQAFLLAACVVLFALGTQAATGKVIKVLPQRLDLQGRHALSPSLYDRDAYQAYLRHHPKLCSGMRFDVQWKAHDAEHAQLQIRVEMVTTHFTKSRPLVLKQRVQTHTGWSHWTSVKLVGKKYRQAGDIIAWRVTLRAGEKVLSEQQSFLW